jgi:hypothetical protein
MISVLEETRIFWKVSVRHYKNKTNNENRLMWAVGRCNPCKEHIFVVYTFVVKHWHSNQFESCERHQCKYMNRSNIQTSENTSLHTHTTFMTEYKWSYSKEYTSLFIAWHTLDVILWQSHQSILQIRPKEARV